MNKPFPVLLALIALTILCACEPSKPQVTRIEISPSAPSKSSNVGAHPLNLGQTLFINGKFEWRDGILYIPKNYDSSKPLPLLVWLHGGGGSANEAEYMFPLADQFDIVILAIDSRHNTWDGIDSPFGPDVEFIEKAMRYTFERVAIKADKIALGGISNGASYSLALGRSNGDLFSHIVAAAPWQLESPSAPIGKPKILVVHGTEDNVYPVLHSRKILVPSLKKKGYDVTYIEFDGPHWVPEEIVIKIFTWLLKSENDNNGAPTSTKSESTKEE